MCLQSVIFEYLVNDCQLFLSCQHKMKFFWLVVPCVIGSLLIENALGAPSAQESATNSTVEKAEKLNYRLSTEVVPVDYIIELTPYFNNESGKEAFTFDGSVKITLQSTQADIKTITLHKEDLDISEQTLAVKSKYFPMFPWELQNYTIDHNEYDDRTKKYSIILSESLVQHQLYELNIKYTGKLRTDMLGFYRSSYNDGNMTKYVKTFETNLPKKMSIKHLFI